MLVHRRITPSIILVGTYLYIWVEGSIMRVERTNHEATKPEWKVALASKYRDTAYLVGVQWYLVLRAPF